MRLPFFHRSRREREMEEELRSHVQHRADDLERFGLSRAEAERRARVEFGGRVRFKEECREALGGNFLETLVQDARFSLRVLRKSPAFTIIAIATLALAIGANAVVFGVLNALILRPLHVPRSESLYSIQRGREHSPMQSYPDYRDLRDRNRSFDGLAAWSMTAAGLNTGESPFSAWTAMVSANYFDLMGIEPYLGRFFHSSDEHGPNSAPYIVLSYDFWHSHFLDDREVVGRVVRLNKYPFTILGVAPREFQGTLLFVYPDFYTPLVNEEQITGWNGLEDRRSRSLFSVLGHLKAGVTPAQAIADLNSIGADLEKSYPKEDGAMTFTLARPGLFGDFLRRPIGAFLTGLTVLAGLILLAACANLGSLFAARAADRSREVALRLALGSSAVRVLRGLFTEAVLVSLIGGAVGLAASVALLRGLSLWQPLPQYPLHIPVSPDSRVYLVALALAFLSGILFGLMPVRQVLRTDPYEIVKSGSRTTGGRRITLRDILLAGQIAICAVLVTSSMVAVRGLLRSLHGHFGFEPQNAMLIESDANTAGYRGQEVPILQKRIIDAVKKIPGVSAAGFTNFPPLLNAAWSPIDVFTDETADLRQSNAATVALPFSISPEYFRAAQTALLSGRAFNWHDDQKARRVAVINQEFARRMFGSVRNAVGRYFKIGDGARIQVVGVVEDGKYLTLAEEPKPAMFFPILQSPSGVTTLVIRLTRDRQEVARAIRISMRNVDPGLPYFVETWNQELDFALFPSRAAVVSLGVLGLMGAMLSITGIFGMAAYSVSKRLKELGIRMALGAQRKEVLGAALGRPLRLLIFGSAAGLVLGILASRVLAHVVYQATPRDPFVLTGVVLAMAAVGLLATWIPAQRALSLDPAKLLREE